MRAQLARLGRSALVYGLGGALNRLLGFLLLPFFTDRLTPADYGVLSILLLISFFLIPVFSLGIGSALAPCWYGGSDARHRAATIWTASAILGACTLLLVLVGCAGSGEISRLALGSPAHADAVTRMVLGTALAILAEPWGLVLRFEERARAFVVLSTTSALATIGASAVLVIHFERGVNGMLEGSLIGNALTLALYVAPSVRRFPLAVSRPVGRELLWLGLPLVPGSALLLVVQQGGRYLLKWLDGLDSLGVYTVGVNLGAAMGLAVSAFQNAWLPYFMSYVGKPDEARALFGRVLTYYVLGFGTLALLFTLFARPVVMLMTQPAYHGAHAVVGFSAGAQMLAGVFSVLVPAVYFAKETRAVTLVQAGAAAASLVLGVLLIPFLGLHGAGLALLLGSLALPLFQHAWNVRQGNRYLQVEYDRPRVVRFALVYAGFTAAALWPRTLPFAAEAAIAVAGSGVLAFLGYAQLRPTERALLRERLGIGRPAAAPLAPLDPPRSAP